MLKLLKCKQLSETIMVLNADWLSASLVSGKQEEFETYKMFTKNKQESAESPQKCSSVLPEIPSCSNTKAKTSYDELIELKTTVDHQDDTSSDDDEPKPKGEIFTKEKKLPVSIVNFLL